jgi:hypothetical protein
VKPNTAILNAFKELGFASHSPSRLWARVGEVYHIVEVTHDRRLGGTNVGVLVWHPHFSEEVHVSGQPAIASPVRGELAPDGIQENWSWQEESLDLVQILRVAQSFFAVFGSAADILTCMEDRYVWPGFRDALEHLRSVGKSQPYTDACPAYAVTGGVRSWNAAASDMQHLLSELAVPMGFKVVGEDRLVAIRKRNGVHDCLSVRLDKFGALASIAVFHWLPELWQADRSLKGVYHPFNGSLIDVDGRVLLINTSFPEAVPVDQLRELASRAVRSWEHVSDLGTFRRSIKDEYSLIGQKLARFEKT